MTWKIDENFKIIIIYFIFTLKLSCSICSDFVNQLYFPNISVEMMQEGSNWHENKLFVSIPKQYNKIIKIQDCFTCRKWCYLENQSFHGKLKEICLVWMESNYLRTRLKNLPFSTNTQFSGDTMRLTKFFKWPFSQRMRKSKKKKQSINIKKRIIQHSEFKLFKTDSFKVAHNSNYWCMQFFSLT